VKTLYVLRHAKSSWQDEGLPDHERPLAGRGRKAAKRLAGYMRSEAVAPALVLCSSAARTRETLERVRPGLYGDPVVEVEDELYGAGERTLLARLRRVPDSIPSVMLIGHNPGLEDLVVSLAGDGDRLRDVRAKFPTGALATLEWDGRWDVLAPGAARLTAFVTPRELG
jgi:phosphohistidine phosphatase